jgi:hypothetical protein
MAEESALLTREANAADMPYVLATWVRSYGSRVPSKRRQQAIASFRSRYVDELLRKGARITVLCSASSPSTLHGYVVEHEGAIAWAYVVSGLRKLGFARRMILAALGAYPEQISLLCAVPFQSKRFHFNGHQLRPSTSHGDAHVQGSLRSVSP